MSPKRLTDEEYAAARELAIRDPSKAGAVFDEALRARMSEERLLGALEMAAPHHQGGHSKVGRAIRAAIAKAKGET